ncbi:hypothetical protein F5883DRAFT_23627 [Diaporthe sp. PMI_573]|nr:hypothetical protein F5883DRAFT_23627 [Diaporthaceae sp. PMI_573]
MVQKFRLAAPRAERAIPHGRKFRDFLLDGSAAVLVRLLAVPVKPQIPQPIPANSRNDRCATQTTSGHSFLETPMDGQVKRKADGELLAGSPPHQRQATTQGGHDALTFSDLPLEVHQLVFDHIEFIEDAVCLGLASRYFWTFARDCLNAYYMSLLGQWVGENIVCVGEDTKPDDYPPHLFSDEELDGLRQERNNVLIDDDVLPYVSCNQPFTLYHFALPSVSDTQEVGDLYAKSSRIYSRCRNRSKDEDPALQATYSEIVVTESRYYPKDQLWILRNLTTKEFVRPEPIAIDPAYIRGPHIRLLGFGEVVLSRICWSTSPPVDMNPRTIISRGIWAGHRFDITTLAKHESETDSAEWSDVSSEVAKEIADIWAGEYGADLRLDLCYWYQKRPNRNYHDVIPP